MNKSQQNKIKWYMLSFMCFSTLWGFGNVLNGFVYFNGTQVIFSWILMFALYFVPYALMVGELGSAFKNSGGGVSSWIHETTGAKAAYYAGWTYWACHVTYIASKGSGGLKALSWMIFQNAEKYASFNTKAVQLVTFAVLLFLLGYILVTGIPHLKPSLFQWNYTSENVSMMPAILATVETTALALLLAVPLGLFTAVYLNEYAKRGNKLVNVIRITTETLSGIPSIVYGLFGMLFFVTRLHWGYSLLAGAMTLAIMILPLIMRTAEEALIAVPDSYREGSFGLGAGRLRTVFRIVLPAAGPGILSGVILGIGRIVGETAALIFTAGTMAQIPGLFQSGRTLAIHMYVLSGEALHMNEANATAVVLLLVVLLMNTLSALAAKKLTKK